MTDPSIQESYVNSTHGRLWTESETKLLLDFCKQYGKDYEKIASHIPERERMQCAHRARALFKNMKNGKMPVDPEFFEIMNTPVSSTWHRNKKPTLPDLLEKIQVHNIPLKEVVEQNLIPDLVKSREDYGLKKELQKELKELGEIAPKRRFRDRSKDREYYYRTK